MIETDSVPGQVAEVGVTLVEPKTSYESFQMKGSHDGEMPDQDGVIEFAAVDPSARVETTMIAKQEVATNRNKKRMNHFEVLKARIGALAGGMMPAEHILRDCESIPRVGFGFCGAIQPFDNLVKVLCFSSQDDCREETQIVKVGTCDEREGEEDEEGRLGLAIFQTQTDASAAMRAIEIIDKVAKAEQLGEESRKVDEKERIKAEAAAMAKAEEEAKVQALAEALAQAKAKAEAEAEAKAEAEARAKAEAEARAKAEAEARAKAEAEARAKAEAEAKALAEAAAKAKAKAEAAAKAKAKAEAKAKVEAAAKAKVQARARALAEAKAAAKAKAKAEAAAKAADKAKARAEAEAKFAEKAKAKAQAKAVALVEAEAVVLALEEDHQKEGEQLRKLEQERLESEAPEALNAPEEEEPKPVSILEAVVVEEVWSQRDDLSLSDVFRLNEEARAILFKNAPVKEVDVETQKITEEDLRTMNKRAKSIVRTIWKKKDTSSD